MSRTFVVRTFLYDAEMARWLNDLERRFAGLTLHSVTAVVGTGGHLCCTVTASYLEESWP